MRTRKNAAASSSPPSRSGLILMGVVAGLVIEVGHTMAHRRHLQVQTDAAALAAAQAWSLCTFNPDWRLRRDGAPTLTNTAGSWGHVQPASQGQLAVMPETSRPPTNQVVPSAAARRSPRVRTTVFTRDTTSAPSAADDARDLRHSAADSLRFFDVKAMRSCTTTSFNLFARFQRPLCTFAR